MPHKNDIIQPLVIGEGLTDKVYEKVLTALREDPNQLVSILEVLHQSDIADLIEQITPKKRAKLIQYVGKERLGNVLTELSTGVQDSILQNFSKEELALALKPLESDDAADLILHLDEDQVEDAGEVIKDHGPLLSYPEDSAGGLMQLEVLALPGDWTVGDVLEYIREDEEGMPRYIHTIYIVGYKMKLLGNVSLSRLVRLPLSDNLNDVMREDSVTVDPYMDQEEVAHLFEKYDIFNCAVVSSIGQLMGVITIDDVVDVIVEEHEQDFMRAAGLKEGEDLFAPVVQTSKSRLPWLFINLMTAVLASAVIAMFEDQIDRLVVLAILMPIVASMGGNAGMQSLTVAVRGICLCSRAF